MSYKKAMKHWNNHRKDRFRQPMVMGYDEDRLARRNWLIEQCKELGIRLATLYSTNPLLLANFQIRFDYPNLAAMSNQNLELRFVRQQELLREMQGQLGDGETRSKDK